DDRKGDRRCPSHSLHRALRAVKLTRSRSKRTARKDPAWLPALPSPPGEQQLPDEEQRLGRDEHRDGDLEHGVPALAHQIDEQREVVLYDAQLVIERAVTLLDLERRAQAPVQTIE